MTTPSDGNWPRLLALAVHEFRSPISVLMGYMRMAVPEQGMPLTDHHRWMFKQMEKSQSRLAALVAEMSELSGLEGGTVKFNRTNADLRTVLAEAVAASPAVPDRDVRTDLKTGDAPAMLQADVPRLTAAFSSLVWALRRELVTSDLLFVRERSGEYEGKPASWIAMGDADHIEGLAAATPNTLETFDEWRGGCGLSLAVGRRVINAHGGTAWSPTDGVKGGAVVVIPSGQPADPPNAGGRRRASPGPHTGG